MRILAITTFLSATLSTGCMTAHQSKSPVTIETTQIGGLWRGEVHFTDHRKDPPPIVPGDTDGLPWPPLFHASPDGKWILCIQKTGSGENASWLYQINEAGKVIRMKERLDAMAWRFSDAHSRYRRTDLYHTGIEFNGWMPDGSLHFSLRGSAVEKSGEGVTLQLAYDLKANKIKTP